ncbi:hypothetical protein HOLleu_39255 [Holothuria leucospilota]|uniref:Uncharacterized protein n=1 Tax=Holothuria leucospilota TaxID=206669 RepID=A0A9Q1BE00_HOLLE|nr:hypothetical protein HOLleu_39255 [Holothuria leucospilota]
MEVNNIASEVNVQGGNNTISIGNRTVHNHLTINNYYVSHNDSQQPAPTWNPSLPTALRSDMFEEGGGRLNRTRRRISL